MKRFIGVVLVMAFGLSLCGLGRAEDKDVTSILDKAIKALGGEDKLGAVKAASWKAKGTITFGGNDNNVSSETTVQGLGHFRQEFEGEFNGQAIKGVTVVSGDKGWRKFGEEVMELDKDALANAKRTIYLQFLPITVVPLKGKDFKVESAGEEKINGKPAVCIKVTGPDTKDFKLCFDKETGLPVQLIARVVGFMNDEFTQETTLSDYQDFGGIKRATKILAKRDGEKFQDMVISGFKVLDKVDPKTFEEPK
jgi:hypothetical protein